MVPSTSQKRWDARLHCCVFHLLMYRQFLQRLKTKGEHYNIAVPSMLRNYTWFPQCFRSYEWRQRSSIGAVAMLLVLSWVPHCPRGDEQKTRSYGGVKDPHVSCFMQLTRNDEQDNTVTTMQCSGWIHCLTKCHNLKYIAGFWIIPTCLWLLHDSSRLDNALSHLQQCFLANHVWLQTLFLIWYQDMCNITETQMIPLAPQRQERHTMGLLHVELSEGVWSAWSAEHLPWNTL